MRRLVLRHGPLCHAIQPLQQVSMAEARVPHKTVEPLGCGPDRLLRAHYTPRHLRQQRRPAAQNPLHRQLAHRPQPLLRRAPQDRLQEQLQIRLQLRHRKFVISRFLQYACHRSALHSVLVVSTPKHTARGGVLQTSTHLWVITNFPNKG